MGYKTPPEEHRFPKGKSGNPSGRPRGRSSLEQVFLNRLYRKMTVKIGGKAQKVSVLEAAVERQIQQLFHAPADRALAILKFLQPFVATPETPQEEFNYDALTDDELEQLERLVTKAAGQQYDPLPSDDETSS